MRHVPILSRRTKPPPRRQTASHITFHLAHQATNIQAFLLKDPTVNCCLVQLCVLQGKIACEWIASLCLGSHTLIELWSCSSKLEMENLKSILKTSISHHLWTFTYLGTSFWGWIYTNIRNSPNSRRLKVLMIRSPTSRKIKRRNPVRLNEHLILKNLIAVQPKQCRPRITLQGPTSELPVWPLLNYTRRITVLRLQKEFEIQCF